LNYGDVNNPTGALIGLSPGADDSTFSARFKQESGRRYPSRPFAEFFDGEFDLHAIAQRFYLSHPDNFDLLLAWGASSIPDPTGGEGFAFHLPIRNDASGIGRPVGNFGGGPAAFGSAGRLQGMLNMTSLRFYPSDPNQNILGFATDSMLDILGQESGHRWLAFLLFRDGNQDSSELLGRDRAHWSFFFNSDASEMEGNLWQDNGDGTFTTIDATERYSALDQYVIGLRSPAEVPDFWFIRNPSRQTSCFDQGPQACSPEVGVSTAGTRVSVSLDQIIQSEGPRLPAAGGAPTTFRQAFILVVPQGQTQTQITADLQKLDRFRLAWEAFFTQATDGRGTVITRLSDPMQ
jgi:hypothetical protein